MENLFKMSGEKSKAGWYLLFVFTLFGLKAIAQGESLISSEEENGLTPRELLNYVYMIAGFVIVLGVAWFTTNRSKKRRENGNEENHHHHYIKHPHLHRRYHHHHHPVFRK